MVADIKKQTKRNNLLIPHERRNLIEHDVAKDQLRDKSVIICPDTNVLIRMIKIEKYDKRNEGNANYLKQLEHCLFDIDKWFSQIKVCKKLFSMNEIGWVISQQVLEEISNSRDGFFNLENYRNNLKSAEKSSPPELQKIIHSAVKKFDKLIKEATEARRQIIDDLIFLQGTSDHVSAAWELVRDGDFPNDKKNSKTQDKQQMKDSVILCHLLDFHINIKKPLFFWTFDMFGRGQGEKPASQFFIKTRKDSISIIYDIRDALSKIKEIQKSKISLNLSGA